MAYLQIREKIWLRKEEKAESPTKYFSKVNQVFW